jgi:hypothetical protein
MQSKRLRTLSLVTALAGVTSVATYGQIAGLKNQEVWAPTLPGSTTFAGCKYTIVDDGNDIWGGSDNFHYAYITVTGDFDYIAMSSRSRVRTTGPRPS